MRTPILPPTVGARRVADIPAKEFYLGFKVRSLMTGRIGIIGDWEDIWDDQHYIDILWENGNDSSLRQSDYDVVEEYLEDQTL